MQEGDVSHKKFYVGPNGDFIQIRESSYPYIDPSYVEIKLGVAQAKNVNLGAAQAKNSDQLPWKRVCGHDFTQSDANVICRMYGYPQGAENYKVIQLGK